MVLGEPEIKLRILEMLAGRPVTLEWGAAVGQAKDTLRGEGYVTADWRLTEKGRQYLADRGRAVRTGGELSGVKAGRAE